MPQVTRALLRKRAEHNEGIISTLQELSLHQEELESINDVIGSTCRKLKILYLQNNIITRMENLLHLKDLEYLNLALNNITKIEGLQNCEFLNKLDLTVNFIDLDELEPSIVHLSTRLNLRDLYMMGNPCQSNWDGFNYYVYAKIPQLQTLDGTEITRSMRIIANQKLPGLEVELRAKAAACRQMKAVKASVNSPAVLPPPPPEDDDVVETIDSQAVKAAKLEDKDRLTDHSPETRNEIYLELAQQKREKEERERANQPKERDYEREHGEAKASIRQREDSAKPNEIRQKNEGQWEFRWDESVRDRITLEVFVSRHLDSSLIDVDVHPTYVSIVIKGKLLRLLLPAEVRVADSKCQRSKVTGALMVVMPKVNPKENFGGVYVASNVRGGRVSASTGVRREQGRLVRKTGDRRMPLQEQLLAAATTVADANAVLSKAVCYKDIVRSKVEVGEASTVCDGPSTNTLVQEIAATSLDTLPGPHHAVDSPIALLDCSGVTADHLGHGSTNSLLAID